MEPLVAFLAGMLFIPILIVVGFIAFCIVVYVTGQEADGQA